MVYDDNEVTIDGGTDLALSDDAAQRFRAYGWHVIELGEAAEDLDALEAGLRDAAAVEDRPSLVILRSVIAHPAPQASGTPAAHGYAILDEEIAATKDLMGLPTAETFHVPSEVLGLLLPRRDRGPGRALRLGGPRRSLRRRPRRPRGVSGRDRPRRLGGLAAVIPAGASRSPPARPPAPPCRPCCRWCRDSPAAAPT